MFAASHPHVKRRISGKACSETKRRSRARVAEAKKASKSPGAGARGTLQVVGCFRHAERVTTTAEVWGLSDGDKRIVPFSAPLLSLSLSPYASPILPSLLHPASLTLCAADAGGLAAPVPFVTFLFSCWACASTRLACVSVANKKTQ